MLCQAYSHLMQCGVPSLLEGLPSVWDGKDEPHAEVDSALTRE